MSFRSRANWTVRWIGLGILMVLVAAWLASGWGYAGYNAVGKSGGHALVVASGAVNYIRYDGGLPSGPGALGTGWVLNRFPFVIGTPDWKWGLWEWTEQRPPVGAGGPAFVGGHVSLAVPIFLFGMPSAILWYRRFRHVPPGHCRKCRYDLAGVTNATCPECGWTVA